MKTRKSLLAEKLTLEQAIHALEAKAQNITMTKNLDRTVSLKVQITPTDIKQMASLRTKLAQISQPSDLAVALVAQHISHISLISR